MANAKDRNIDVVIRADANEPHGVKFAMPGGNLIFENNKHDGFMVYFNIVDPDSTGYLFPDNLNEALWVLPIAPNGPDVCPQQAANWEQFEAKEVMNGNTTLRVRNKNKFKQRFGFTLRVTKNPSANGPCIPYDPIGDNRNGPSSRLFAIVAVTIGLVAVAVTAWVAFDRLGR